LSGSVRFPWTSNSFNVLVWCFNLADTYNIITGFSQPPLLNRCMVAFPEDYKLLVPGLLIETMNSISASFVTRIDTFTSEATAASRALIGGIFIVNGSSSGRIFIRNL